ncbi:29416_t:CDS:1 [Racocetra persica]|uniref:29416_t:CDS:1 n=1 Tax=Racocetra persica TaxID=160502 RepID=A0ACA9MYD8_9GLOM|nr:29416_t:CDS:1 [Racocetra persica]
MLLEESNVEWAKVKKKKENELHTIIANYYRTPIDMTKFKFQTSRPRPEILASSSLQTNNISITTTIPQKSDIPSNAIAQLEAKKTKKLLKKKHRIYATS